MNFGLDSNAYGRTWRAVAVVLMAGLALAVVLTFRDYGISWDEEVQNIYGTKLLAFYASGFRDRGALSYMNLYFYGGFFDLLAAIWNEVSPFGTYATRHLWGGVFFIYGLWGAWRLTALIATPRAAAIAVALLGCNALLFGHAFINPKDAPLGWLSLWLIYYAARAIREGIPRTSTILGFAITAGLAMGTRIMAAPTIGYVACALAIGAVAHRLWPREAPAVGRTALSLAAALPLAYAVMALCWPWAILRPLNAVRAFHEFANFPWEGQILWNGQMVPSLALPWDYLLVLLGVQLSEAVLVGLVLAVIAGLRLFATQKFALLQRPQTLGVLIVMAAALVPPAAFIVLRPTVYNGLRHFLFMIPPLVVLAALGWDALLAALPRLGARVATGAALTLLLALQVSAMVRLHPYQYVAYNALIGGLPGAAGRFELDYWDTSFAEAGRALAQRLAARSERAPTVLVCGNKLSAEVGLPPDVRYTYKVEEADYLMSIVPSPCGYLADVSRNHVVEISRMGVVLSFVVDLRAQRGQ